MALPGEGAETLASVLTGLKDPKLADDPLVLHALEAGADLVEEALDHAPTSAETHPFLSYLSRGSVVRAIVVLRDGIEPSDALKSELQEHVKAETAPNKYPRIVDFAAELPKTASGKVQRALLRARLD